MAGSGEGISSSDPPFAQLGGETSGGWRDTVGQFGYGLFEATAPESMKRAFHGSGQMKAFQKRRDMIGREQYRGLGEGKRLRIRQQAEEKLREYEGGS